MQPTKGYPWPSSALTATEMAILYKCREETKLPICQLLRLAVHEFENKEENHDLGIQQSPKGERSDNGH